MKFGKYKISIALSLAFGFLFFVINAGVVHAQYTASESLGDLGTSPLNQVENSDVLAKSAAESAAAEAVAGCKEITIPKCDTADCSAAITALNNIKTCMNEATKNNAKIINTSEWKKYVKEYADKQAEIARHAAIASAFKSSLSLMSKQLAVDTATWIASGGKGQKPLFITEGWGAYLKNLGDSALGDFIDQVGQRYGVDLCKSPTLSLSIQTSLNWKKPRQVRCTFSKMMTNWESAITDPNFAFEYNNSLNSGENDLSVYLKLSGESLVYVADKVKVGELDVAPEGWKAVKDFAGKVLTPGDVVKEWLTTKVFQSSSLAEETFTGTVADFVNTFVQTLVGQLLNNFKS